MQGKIEKPFTLVMLGTDTKFTPELKKASKKDPLKVGDTVVDYPKGETLSIIASLVETATAAVRDDKSPISFRADEVTVVNGPDTYAKLVGERIAQGLVSALNAIGRGQTTINIIAHSRGAVESILISHELEAIYRGIAACNSLDDLIQLLSAQQTERHKKRPTNNTPDIIATIKTLLPAKEAQDAWFQALKSNVPQAKINFFGIDPVPGDCWPITWYDERYFTLPPIVKNAQIIYYENERSDWGFSPLSVEGTPGARQEIVRLTMPGHHGTGSTGSHGSQLNKVVVGPDLKTTHVQKLMIFKLLRFLTDHGTSFRDGRDIFREHSAIGKKLAIQHHKIPRPNDTDPILVQELDYDAIFEKLYAEIVKRREGYRAFNKTAYPAMGVLTSGRRFLYNDTNINPKTGHAYRALADKFPLETDYINTEHSKLMEQFFFKLFKVNGLPNRGPADLIERARLILSANIKKALGEQEPASAADMSQDAPLALGAARADVLKTFKSVIQHVSQQYINDDWSKEDKQKEDIFQAIIDILHTFYQLKTLAEAKKVKDLADFTNELLKMSLAEITHTIEHKHNTLEDEYNRLQRTTDDKLKLFFTSIANQFLQEVPDGEAAQVASDEPIMDAITKMLAAPEYSALANYPIEAKMEHLLRNLAHHPKLRAFDKINLAALKESFDAQFGDKLDDFATLYQTIQVLIADLGGLRRVLPSETAIFDKCELSLRQKSSALIEISAQRFYKERAPRYLPEVASKNSFAELAEHYAIRQLWIADRVQEKLHNLQRTLSSEALAKQHLAKELAAERERILVLTQQVQDISLANKSVETALTAEKVRVEELEQQLNTESAAKEHIAQDLQTGKVRIEELERQLRTETETKASVARDLQASKVRIEELERQLKTEAETKDALARSLQAEKAHSEKLKQQLSDESIAKDDVAQKLQAEKARSEKLEQQLADESATKDSVAQKLQAEKARSEKLELQLADESTAKDSVVQNLQAEKARSEKLELQLADESTAKDSVAQNLQAEKARSEKLEQKLADESAAKDSVAQKLQAEKARSEKLEQQLSDESTTKDDVAQKVHAEKARSEELKQQLETESLANAALKQDLEKEKANVTKFQKIANNKDEAQLLLLIEDKLRPLTRDYLKNLEKSKDPGVLRTTKIARVNSLIQCLEDNTLNTKPSARVRAFYTELNNIAHELKAHRDNTLFRFIRNALIAAGILISGILPGLLVLDGYRRAGNSSLKSLSFWESTGATVTRKLKSFEPELGDETDNDVAHQPLATSP